MMEVQNEKWVCSECWKIVVAKPDETPPIPNLRMICDECGAQKVLCTKVSTEKMSDSSR
jgi:DNA-directed RNA polymerase subunit RPC12/RpoP